MVGMFGLILGINAVAYQDIEHRPAWEAALAALRDTVRPGDVLVLPDDSIGLVPAPAGASRRP
ncbi:MAG: hypothetical protein FD153_533 [Rhodospirillaceae bacterium]|nr:MAG: hypothetical protein FD153_533 [Rhodospirillaceae bacterium]